MELELFKIGAAYIRVSDERQDEYSPTSQLKKIRERAERDNVVIPDEYVFYDDGISGRDTKKRNDFNRMISLAKDKSHPFEVIYVWKFSRFARSQEQSIVFKNLLRKSGVSVVSVSETIPEGPFGSLIERVIEWMDEFYSINLSAEVKRGFEEKISRGEPIVPPPFGYIIKEGKYIPDEENGRAEAVRTVFALYASGVKQREIAVEIFNRGIRTQNGKMPSKRWVEYMLHNPCYIGKLRHCTDGTRSVSKRHLDNESILVVDGHHEPLISLDLWDKVQKMLEEQKLKYSKYARSEQPVEYMLKGLVRCSACGGTLAANGLSGKNKTRCLQCCNYARAQCHTSHSITMTKIENAFMEGIMTAVNDLKFNIVAAKKEKKDTDVDFDKLIAIDQKRLERAKEAYLSEVDTIEQYAANKKEITERIEKLIKMRDEKKVETVDVHDFKDKVLMVVDLIKRDDVTPIEKNDALRTIIHHIIYEKANDNLAIYFHDAQSS